MMPYHEGNSGKAIWDTPTVTQKFDWTDLHAEFSNSTFFLILMRTPLSYVPPIIQYYLKSYLINLRTVTIIMTAWRHDDALDGVTVNQNTCCTFPVLRTTLASILALILNRSIKPKNVHGASLPLTLVWRTVSHLLHFGACIRLCNNQLLGFLSRFVE